MRYLPAFIPLFILLFSGCSENNVTTKQSAIYWYQEMVKEVARGNGDRAGDNYLSLLGEHVKSPLLPEAMLIMARMHMQKEEYLLANYYYDEYIKRYGNAQNIPYIKFLKLKAKYYGLSDPKREQQLLIDTKKEAQAYIDAYPKSIYRYYAGTILVNIEATEVAMNNQIAKLYGRLDKEKAADFYQNKSRNDISLNDFSKPESFWLKALFE